MGNFEREGKHEAVAAQNQPSPPLRADEYKEGGILGEERPKSSALL
jgi:hypothetical protein